MLLYDTISYHTMLSYIILYHYILYYILVYHTIILYHIISYYIILYYTISIILYHYLYSMAPPMPPTPNIWLPYRAQDAGGPKTNLGTPRPWIHWEGVARPWPTLLRLPRQPLLRLGCNWRRGARDSCRLARRGARAAGGVKAEGGGHPGLARSERLELTEHEVHVLSMHRLEWMPWICINLCGNASLRSVTGAGSIRYIR